MRIALLFFFAAMVFAGQGQKPACKAGNNGAFWPAEANSSRAAFQQFMQSGELEICTVVVWKYKWQPLSLNIHKMGSNSAWFKRGHAVASSSVRSSD